MLFFGFKVNFVSLGSAGLQTVALGFLLYNTVAFGLQPFIGYFCDKKEKFPVALIGCGLLIAGLILIAFPWVSLLLCALGNACFHVGGGIDSLVYAGGKMARSGIFVSSGALGVSLGTLAGQSGRIPLFVPILFIVLSGVMIAFFELGNRAPRPATRFAVTKNSLAFSLVLGLCLFSIVIRSYIGSSLTIPWKTTTFLLILPSIASCLGKAAGGFLADWFGAKNTGVLTLLFSVPFLVFGYGHPLYCTIGLFLFNVTMPITLCAVASRFPHQPGFSFGLTTLALLCGNAPTFFFTFPVNAAPYVTAFCIIASAICLFVATANQNRIVLKSRKKMNKGVLE